MSKYYDSQTKYSYNDHWVGHDTRYKIVGLNGNYTGDYVYEAYRGTPEEQGYKDVRTSKDDFSVAWRANQKKDEITKLEARLAELKSESEPLESVTVTLEIDPIGIRRVGDQYQSTVSGNLYDSLYDAIEGEFSRDLQSFKVVKIY